ncbi:MAG: hypothetical protein PHP00_01140 [Thiotrichaceae bacterium]|nr:hypothetical protein [Thiotrichaceae bacterium]
MLKHEAAQNAGNYTLHEQGVNVEIIQILRRAADGITKPFICKGENSLIYVVKGIGAGKRSLICEWIAGCLAQQLQLPIAPFCIVDVPEELLANNVYEDSKYLGIGLAFGSLEQDRVSKVKPEDIQTIPETLQQKIFAFDWWIQNMDRTLTEQGGNPNLLWKLNINSEFESRLVMIDHNLAFDKQFHKQDFIKSHIFKAQGLALLSDKALQNDYTQLFLNALQYWNEICTGIPPEWWFSDAEQTVSVDFDLKVTYDKLMTCQEKIFWSK